MQTENYKQIEGFRHISEVANTAIKNINDIREGRHHHIMTRWKKVNEITQGIQLGEQIVIAARPGVGKSATVNMIAEDIFNKVLNPNLKVILLYWSWEMPDFQQVYRMMSSKTRKTVKELTSSIKPIETTLYEELVQTAQKLKGLPIYFRDTPMTSLAWAKKVEEVHNLFPDYKIVNIIDHTRLVKKSNQLTEEQKITDFMETGVELKNKILCTNIFLSQLNRDIEKEKDRQNIGKNPPVLSDIFGSDAVGQFANTVIILHRPEIYGLDTYLDEITANRIFWHFVKQRDGDLGYISLKHELKYNNMEDLSEEDESLWS